MDRADWRWPEKQLRRKLAKELPDSKPARSCPRFSTK
jgi:hypothetical protein